MRRVKEGRGKEGMLARENPVILAGEKTAILTYLIRGAMGLVKAGRAKIRVANGLDLGDFPLDAEHVEFREELVDGYGIGAAVSEIRQLARFVWRRAAGGVGRS
jgi:hypothetical protein